MLLSELLAADPVPAAAYGVVVDCQDLVTPVGLREVGVVAEFEADGVYLSADVFDLVISCAAAKIETVVEVASHTAIPSPKEFMVAALSCGFSIALLPPAMAASDEAFESYALRLEEFVSLYAETANFGKYVLPVTSYFEYLIVEGIDPEAAKAFVPKDQYVVERFASVVATGRSDAFKDRMRKAFETVYGGPDAFAEFRKALVKGVFDETRANVEDMVRKAEAAKDAYLAQQAAQDATSAPQGDAAAARAGEGGSDV
jgi:hypothetical protein